ncbi:MAG TPA: hypothetical protein VF173_24940 [Thermoanaerobaculia bacterium]|nr:hypothetical protein [Thermoanaerobaculia bacterium]
MDITNDSSTDTKYTVRPSPGTGMGHDHPFPFPPEETAHWEVLAAGATAHCQPPSKKGPWMVYFYVNGRGVSVEASSDNDHVNLMANRGVYHPEVHKVSHAR